MHEMSAPPTPAPFLQYQVLTVQHSLAVQVARAVGSPGSAVLIFVPGMASILAIMDLFELISSADVTYKVRAGSHRLAVLRCTELYWARLYGIIAVLAVLNSTGVLVCVVLANCTVLYSVVRCCPV